jgi:hypothetical protein
MRSSGWKSGSGHWSHWNEIGWSLSDEFRGGPITRIPANIFDAMFGSEEFSVQSWIIKGLKVLFDQLASVSEHSLIVVDFTAGCSFVC